MGTQPAGSSGLCGSGLSSAFQIFATMLFMLGGRCARVICAPGRPRDVW